MPFTLSTQKSKASKSSQKSTRVPWTPEKYQRTAVKFLLEHNASLLLLDPGLGKTSVTLGALKILFKEGVSCGALVVAPLKVVQLVWPAEIDKWRDFEGMTYKVLHELDDEEFSAAVQTPYDVYIINYEGLAKLISSGGLRHMLRAKLIDTLIFDEISKMKHSDTVRARALHKWLPRFARRWGLTGTPAPNGLLDLFGLCYTIDLGNALGMYKTQFRARYFYQNTHDPHNGFTLMPGAEEQIYERLRPLALRMQAEDYITLPVLQTNIIRVELPAKAKRAHDKLEAELWAEIQTARGDRAIQAASAGVAASRCRQIASGALYYRECDPETGLELGKPIGYDILHDMKLQALSDLFEELNGHQLLVGYEFQHDQERIRKAFPQCVFMRDANTLKRAQEIEAAWNAGEVPMLAGHPANMAHGLNLQGSDAHHIAWFTSPYNLEYYDQFIARLRRRGNKATRIINHHIVARGTVEEYAVLPALRRKAKLQSALLQALKEKYSK
jgi:SNF2 family DNA or RNA helicase